MKAAWPKTSVYRVVADGVTVFYREAGPADAPVILLLHGYPASSFQFRDLMPRLADRWRVIAPDLPGFGFTEVPGERHYRYTFAALAQTIIHFTEALHLTRYAMYVFDYGAPAGFRVAMAHPERVTAIVSQNGNAYEEGLGDAWAPVQRYWANPTPENRDAIRRGLNAEAMRKKYEFAVADPSAIPPESYTLDSVLLARPGNVEIQLDLFLDYANNVKLYPAFQDYFRTWKPPLLAIWGNRDPYFIPPGAEAFRRDIPEAVVQFLDTGHFALETHVDEIADSMRQFLAGNADRGTEGIIEIHARHSVDQTVEKLKAVLQAKGVTLFAVVDHSGEAEKAGLKMPPTKLLIFGNPKAGTPLMLASPSIAIDLPLKILVREDQAGQVWISYNDPRYLGARHRLPDHLLNNIAVIESLAITAGVP
ncbi:MAG TPA: alpha/beta fold hydrolase [Bryobacteraceae bacterium]|nr:alpha/beta fold hydrolase [Bryobacteraceae bacterium]